MLFSLILCAKILFGDKDMDAVEWRYFLAGPSGAAEIPKNPTDWLGELEWAEVYKQLHGMAQLPAFAGIDKSFMENDQEFKKFFDSTTPQEMPLPGDWNESLNSF